MTTSTDPAPDDRHRGAGAADRPQWAQVAREQGISRYLEALRAGRWLIIGTLVLCLGAAVLYLSRAETQYEAAADVLVTPQQNLEVPVPGVIVASNDPTRDVETASRLITQPAVIERAVTAAKSDLTVAGVQSRVSVAPLASSNIVTVTARGSTPEEARDLANAVSEQFVAYRTARLHETLDGLIKNLRPEAAEEPNAQKGLQGSATSDLRFLENLRLGDDPSVRVESAAQLPTGSVAPRPVLTLGAALVAGIVLGLVGAFGLQLIDPRVRREDQLRAAYQLPILARIPLERKRAKRPLLPSELSLGALDGYQALRASLTTARRESLRGRLVMLTGANPGDGKSTTAINLASTLAAADKRVILVEADSRRPSIGKALGVTPEIGLASVVTGRRYLVDALVPVGSEDSKLRVLLNSADEAPASDVLSSLSADTLLLQAQRLADWVIVDAPPLNHVAETIALARAVDDVLIVVRVGRTNTRDLEELAEMLVQQDITPAGFVVLGGHARQGYY